jgi:RNA-directed DNA polymerase
MEGGLVRAVEEGTPQGGPWSPLLSNIVPGERDPELERRGPRCVRQGDDGNICVRSRRAGERVMASITRCITAKLKPRVHQHKSAVARPWERKFLGCSFTSERETGRRIAPKAIARCKKRERERTRRTRGVSIERMAEELARYLRGWLGYFGKCETPRVLGRLEQWPRRRPRSVQWQQWRRGAVRFGELRRRGVGKSLAARTAGSARGSWRLAGSPALHLALPNACFASPGLPRWTMR